MRLISLFSCILAATLALIQADSNADLVNAKVERTIDLTSHLARVTTLITVENKAASGSLKTYTYTIEPAHAKNVAFVGAHSVEAKQQKARLNVVEVSKDSDRGALYRVDFTEELPAGKSAQIQVEVVLFGLVHPYPEEITQSEKQLVVFKGNHYFYSLYPTKSQTTSVNLASDKTESYSQLKPTSKSDSTITYGPYENVKPFELSELSVHFENNAPFLTVTNLHRTIEVSLWGNIAVEETIDMSHTGAKLKGSFSRFDYMRRQGGHASVKSFKTLLPSLAADVYYRDEIGNISTSNLRVPAKSKGEPAELELRPRFPLFGGWKTHYTVGYNLPVYQYLHNSGSNFALRIKLLDHVCDDQLIENAQIAIILPEHATNIELVAPYKVERRPDQKHFTYLDTVGRPVVVINKKYAIDNHVQDIKIKFTYNKVMLLQKPILVVLFFFVLFLAVILISKFDFSIVPQVQEHAKSD